MKIKKILVANRGEIAIRIMRSCREMGISTVAIFSEADRNAPFVCYADDAVCIGTAAASQSYLNGKKIIDVCKKLKADAIHPGYGFLSENADFAREVEKNKIIFIGPSPETMEMMGDKLSAKAIAKKYNIPMIPGTDGAISDIAEAKMIAKKIGFPILIKASAGGGGKGMRVVENDSEYSSLEEEILRASSEAMSAFGNGDVFIEKYIENPRHVEIQILADKHGNVIYLFERECSVQRRHQKVIEESPSAVLTSEIRKQMGECAVSLAKACGYVNAGTVEFLVDAQLNFYFLEVNTRLQVEHPVTEMITGIDLVKEQIIIAQGEKLSFTQDELVINGHALEVRVYAEDPANDFLPYTGKITSYKIPQGAGIRVDDGFEEGMEISIHYDPMIAKLISHGRDRGEAITRMLRAIDEYKIIGVETTLPFCKFVLQHEAFVSGNFDTHFVKKHFSAVTEVPIWQKMYSENEEEAMIATLVAAEFKNIAFHRMCINLRSSGEGKPESGLHIANNFSSSSNWKRNRLKDDD